MTSYWNCRTFTYKLNTRHAHTMHICSHWLPIKANMHLPGMVHTYKTPSNSLFQYMTRLSSVYVSNTAYLHTNTHMLQVHIHIHMPVHLTCRASW